MAIGKAARQGASLYVLSARAELAEGMKAVGSFALGTVEVTVLAGRDSLWALCRRGPEGGVLLRAACAPGLKARKLKPRRGECFRVALTSALGRHVVSFAAPVGEFPVLRVTTRLTPSHDMLVPFLPRDLYPLGPGDDPLRAEGRVEAAQRGLNAAVCYFRLDRPAIGSLLYMQNLTAMNAYFEATKTKPDAAVGGEWPELGYLPPAPPQSGTPPVDPLPAGIEVTLSDAFLVFQREPASGERHSAECFLQMLAAVYRHIDKPEPELRDWPARARRTLRDLADAPVAAVRHYGHLYVRPYVDAEYPDSMVQLSLLAAIRDWAAWTGEPVDLADKLASGLGRFFDPELGTIRRYLPNVGSDKNANAVDSWYLYHPLLNLGRMALDGDRRCRTLFLKSLDFAIRAARHFRYAWPIQYDITDFSVIVQARNDDGLGQTDVGGLYAYVMLLAYELTSEERYLREARNAIDAAQGMRFELNYQANLTAWGAAACMRLWRITNQQIFLKQSYVYLASFFHNSAIWEARFGAARHYPNFLGVTALHDGPYMALFECFDSFRAMEQVLKDSGPELDPAVRLLVTEYCRFALDRAWFYYPDALPPDLLCREPRNGHIDPSLSFPVEDLYVGGDQAGQVGQEVYGAGAAFIFASKAFHRINAEPLLLFCDHFCKASDQAGGSIAFQLTGDPASHARFSVLRAGRKHMPPIGLALADGVILTPVSHHPDRIDYAVPAAARFSLSWM